MAVTYGNTIGTTEFNALRRAVGWELLPEEQARAGIDATFLLVSCREDDQTVGCAKLLWDHGYIAYLADVMVHPRWQGQGIGRTMVTSLLEQLKDRIPTGWKVRVFLCAAKDKEPFYKSMGFRSRPNAQFGAGMDLEMRK